ncbi:hypothetical protein M758_7G070200 [Ceratodon purpureus]|nr:hypothetical protein M758_7G070200 [Ceratodon purpureus]
MSRLHWPPPANFELDHQRGATFLPKNYAKILIPFRFTGVATVATPLSRVPTGSTSSASSAASESSLRELQLLQLLHFGHLPVTCWMWIPHPQSMASSPESRRLAISFLISLGALLGSVLLPLELAAAGLLQHGSTHVRRFGFPFGGGRSFRATKHATALGERYTRI